MYESAPIPRSDIIRYLNSKAPRAKCSACGHGEFSVTNEMDLDGKGLTARLVLVGFPFPGYEIPKAKTVEVLALACNNCGTIWQVLRKAVTSWLAVNPS